MPGNGHPGFVGNSCSDHTEQLFVLAYCLLKKLYALTFKFFCANAPFLNSCVFDLQPLVFSIFPVLIFVCVEQLLTVFGSWLSSFTPHTLNLQQRDDNLWSLFLSSILYIFIFASVFLLTTSMFCFSSFQSRGLCRPSWCTDYEI